MHRIPSLNHYIIQTTCLETLSGPPLSRRNHLQTRYSYILTLLRYSLQYNLDDLSTLHCCHLDLRDIIDLSTGFLHPLRLEVGECLLDHENKDPRSFQLELRRSGRFWFCASSNFFSGNKFIQWTNLLVFCDKNCFHILFKSF